MRRYLIVVAGLSALATPVAAQDAKSVLARAQTAMGNPASVQYSGSGMNAFFGQAIVAGGEWPHRPLDSVTAAVDYDHKAAALELAFHNPVFGGQRQNTFVSGDRAWSATPAGTTAQLASATAQLVIATAQLASAEERQLQIWMTPHGFLRAAAAANPTVTSRTQDGAKVDVVSFTVMNKFKLTGTIDGQGLVTEVQTLFPNPVLGDMPYGFTYAGYKDFGGLKFPSHIIQTEGGFPVNDVTVTSAQPSVSLDLAVPPAVQSAVAAPVRTEVTQLGDGVWFVGGGSHHSLVVAFDKFITVIESPLSEERSVAVMTEARKLAPGKPIKYLVLTHHHFDHTGGLRAYIAEGVTVVTQGSNKAYFEMIAAAPATLAPDLQSKARKAPLIQSVTDKYVITDGKQSIDVYNTPGDSHAKELIVAYVVPAKVLVEADSYTPVPPGAPPPSTGPAEALILYDNIQHLKLDVATVVGIHGRGPVPMAEFTAYVGKN